MKLEEAIKQQEDALADKWCPWSEKLKASIKLGIEALKEIINARQIGFLSPRDLLPGETKE